MRITRKQAEAVINELAEANIIPPVSIQAVFGSQKSMDVQKAIATIMLHTING